ncbi:type II toxin-antitoxin system RelE/ParE family toxin [Niabella aquatica]
MEYNLLISKRALKEIEDAIDYYVQYSIKASAAFVKELQQAYHLLKNNPPERIYYKNIRGLKLSRFPYILYFTIDKKKIL